MTNKTILEHLEKIIAVLSEPAAGSSNERFVPDQDSPAVRGLCKDFYLYAKDSLRAASAYLETTQRQAALFALLLDNFSAGPMSIINLGKKLNCGNLEMLKYIDDFEALKNKKLIRADKPNRYGFAKFMDDEADNFPKYSVPLAVINAVRKGESIKPKTYSSLSPEEFFDRISDIFEAKEDEDIDLDTLDQELKSLFEHNKHISFVKSLGAYDLGNGSALVLLYFCCELINNNNETIQLKELNRLLGRGEVRQIQRRFESREHKLFENGLMEFDCQMGMADTEYYRLSLKAKKQFLTDVNLKNNTRRRGNNIIHADSISVKKLYFSEKIENRIRELSGLLQEDNFINIQKRLGESGMRTGFPCIFSGPPGTGKTETAYQIARQTGRDIFLVDIAESKSKWFGESEKLIKAVFDRYRGMVNSEASDGGRPAPILLFNEADAILGKRRELTGTRSGPGQTENAIQNIILQEMENLNGILIATTNLTLNLDKAFERRFLYKIEFEKPDAAAKKEMWLSMIPAIKEEDASHLAAKFDFSGGQIENISRRYTVDFVLSGVEPSLEQLSAFCKEEQLIKESSFRIGFTAE